LTSSAIRVQRRGFPTWRFPRLGQFYKFWAYCIIYILSNGRSNRTNRPDSG
jgi:hypothetical protein